MELLATVSNANSITSTSGISPYECWSLLLSALAIFISIAIPVTQFLVKKFKRLKISIIPFEQTAITLLFNESGAYIKLLMCLECKNQDTTIKKIHVNITRNSDKESCNFEWSTLESIYVNWFGANVSNRINSISYARPFKIGADTLEPLIIEFSGNGSIALKDFCHNRNLQLQRFMQFSGEQFQSVDDVCKKYKVPLIVDEAHACLWNFNKHLPTPALQLGADAVVHSLHKTGGSMSQSSMLHIAENSMLDVDAVEKALKLLHTTSPSLLLLASLDAARANLESSRGKRQLERAVENAKYLRREIDNMEHIHHLKPDFGYKTDITKVFIKADGLSGKRLESILEIDFNIEVESASDAGLLILSNLGNSRNDIKYLVDCLYKIDRTNYSDICYLENKKHMPMLTPIIKMNLQDSFYAPKETIPKSQAIGRISGEVIAECPPGIAILLPGELITEAHLPYLQDYEFIEVIK